MNRQFPASALLVGLVMAFGLAFTSLTAASMFGAYYSPRAIDVASVVVYGLFLTTALCGILAYLASLRK